MNNKFYDQYKGLFVDGNPTPYFSPSINSYNSNIPPLSSPYTLSKPTYVQDNHNDKLNYKNQDQFKNLFRNYADQQVNQSYINGANKKGFQSIATKELNNVVLPKLKMYDQEIDTRLKRFKTELQQPYLVNNKYSSGTNYHKANDISSQNIKNYSFLNNADSYGNPYANPYGNSFEQSYSRVKNWKRDQDEHSRYKHGYKFKVPSNNIFSKNYNNFSLNHDFNLNHISLNSPNSDHKISNSSEGIHQNFNNYSKIINNQEPLKLQLSINNNSNKNSNKNSNNNNNSAIYPSTHNHENNHIKLKTQIRADRFKTQIRTDNDQDNPQMERFGKRQVNRSRIKRKSPIFYMIANAESDLQTEYQRSYSNKKISVEHQQHKELMRSSPIIQHKQFNYHQLNNNQNENPKNHQENRHYQMENPQNSYKTQKQHITIDHGYINDNTQMGQSYQYKQNIGSSHDDNYRISTEPSSPEHPSNKSHLKYQYQSAKNSRKSTRNNFNTQQKINTSNARANKQSPEVFLPVSSQLRYDKQEGLRFSEYENQYAFINRRLEDISNFNNFYSHKYINSYKLAIMSRLEGKKRITQRRDKLKYILEKEILQYEENGLESTIK